MPCPTEEGSSIVEEVPKKEEINSIQDADCSEKGGISQKYRKGMAQGFVVLTVLNNFTVIGDFFVMLFASTVLTLDKIGLYQLLFQFIPLFTIFINYGFINTSTKFVPYYDSKKEEQKAAAVAYFITILNCLFALIISVIMLLFSRQFSLLLTGTEIFGDYINLIAICLIFVPNATINQLFVVRYKFKPYLVANLVGNLLRIGFTFYFLDLTHDINGFFYGIIIGNGFHFLYLMLQAFFIYQKPNFSIELKEIFMFASSLFLGRILLYLKNYASNLIFYFLIRDLTQLGLLYYIKILFGVVLISFESLHSMLSVYYASFLYNPDAEKEYRATTYQISRFFMLLSFSIGLSFIAIAPFYIEFVVILYNYQSLYSIGVIVMIFYGLYFIANMIYFIPPTVMVINRTNKKLLSIHFFSTIVYLLSFLVFISLFGMIGIPIGQLTGFIVFNALCKRDVEKKYSIGFDWSALKKLSIASMPIAMIIPLLFILTPAQGELTLIDVYFFEFYFSVRSLTYAVMLLSLAFFGFLWLVRHLRLFTISDSQLITQIIGKRFGGYFEKLFIHQKPLDNSE